MKQYTPRRASKVRWLAGAPDHILDCFTTPSGTFEVLYTGSLLLSRVQPRTFASTRIQGREMSNERVYPMFELSAYDVVGYRYRMNKSRVKWSDLPENVQKRAIADAQ